MTSLEKFHFRATRAYRSHAWAMVGLIVAFACLIALADDLINWSGLAVYGVVALALLLTMQPWRNFLELDHHGFKVIGGAQGTVIRWCDVTSLRPAPQRGGRSGGVAYSAEARSHKLFGLIRMGRDKVVSGTIDARLYGISDGQLYQLMLHLRDCSDSRARYASVDVAARLGQSRSTNASRPQANARHMADRAF